MKKEGRCSVLLFILLLTALLPVHDLSFAENSIAFQSAVIQYELKGKNTGSETLYIKGKNVRSITHFITAQGIPVILIDMLSVDDGKHLYVIDLNQRVGARFRSRESKPFEEMSSEEINQYRKDLLLGLPQAGRYDEIDSDTVLGRSCSVFLIPAEKINTRIWVWNNLILKSEIEGMLTFSKEAKDMEIDAQVSNDLFKIPDDIKIEDRSA